MKKSILLAGVFFLTVKVNARGEDWLSQLPDNVAVRELSIPGSHDAATGNGFSAASSMAALFTGVTQSLSLAEQWDAGVRAFDLRPAYKSSADGHLQIYHGSLETKLSMKAAVQTLVDKLTSSPKELAVILMRHESDADSNSGLWAGAVADLFGEFDSYIVKFTPNITLGDARGKIIVLSRDNFNSGKAGMISGWSHSENFSDQTRASISGSGGWVELYAQDFYECQTVERKYKAVTAMLDYSTTHTSGSPWVINHTSGYTGSTGTNSNIQTLAKSLNIQTAEYLNTASAGRTGMVFMDFAGAKDNAVNGNTLVDKIIAQNTKYIVQSGIEEVEAAAQSINEDAVYDLQGRYLGRGETILKTLSPGTYIYNHRKIFVK